MSVHSCEHDNPVSPTGIDLLSYRHVLGVELVVNAAMFAIRNHLGHRGRDDCGPGRVRHWQCLVRLGGGMSDGHPVPARRQAGTGICARGNPYCRMRRANQLHQSLITKSAP